MSTIIISAAVFDIHSAEDFMESCNLRNFVPVEFVFLVLALQPFLPV
ncbi:hypothetical protein ACK8HY_16270 [Sphingobacterium sp. NGMCC 1.201703]